MTLNQWYALAAVDEIPPDRALITGLLGESVSYTVDAVGRATTWRTADRSLGRPAGDTENADGGLPTLVRFGYVWTCLGDAPQKLFDIPEFDEPDRRNLNASTIGVHVSAPRAIENFLDMAHFPFVHTGVLGAEPHTEVREYDVEVSVERDEILATKCVMFQPKSTASSTEGADVDYVYRVPHPFCSVLYKGNGDEQGRSDVIAAFLQPVDEEHIRAHLMLSVIDTEHEDKYIRNFQQSIFGQDKPILENQLPKRLPLDPRAETPIRADKAAVAYRRWLSNKGVTYGTIPVGR